MNQPQTPLDPEQRFLRRTLILLNTFPLSICRQPLGDGTYRLPVILLGGAGQDARLLPLLGLLLSNGQLLDTRLCVTVLTPSAPAFRDALQSRAPYLRHFVTITCDGTPCGEAPEQELAALQLLSGKPERLERLEGEGAYLLVCTGDDGQNLRIGAEAKQRWARAEVLCVQEEGFLRYFTAQRCVPLADKTYQEAELERLAFLQHYCYTKAADPHRPLHQIRQEFQASTYNSVSSLLSAAHVSAKLASLGVHELIPEDAARHLAALFAEKPELIDALAALEHRRWLISKCMDGYCLPEEIWCSIYHSHSGTHDEQNRLHAALLPCRPDSHLTPEDFDNVQSHIRRELDPLDRISLRVYKLSLELGRERAPAIREMLDRLCHALQDTEAGQTAADLRAMVSEVYVGKQYAVALFRQEAALLRRQLARRPDAEALTALLEELTEALRPQLEALLRSDFKSTDILLCRTLPFQLSYKPGFRLVKLLTENTAANLASLYALEPGEAAFFACADSRETLARLDAEAGQVLGFCRRTPLEVRAEFHVFCPASLLGETVSLLTLHDAAGQPVETLLKDFLAQYQPDQMETTGAGQKLLFEVFRAAERIPLFCMENGHPTALNAGALSLTYPHPSKPLTVAALMRMTGCELTASESHCFSAWLMEPVRLKAKGPALPRYWAIFVQALSCADWNLFCERCGTLLAKHSSPGLLLELTPDTDTMGANWERVLAGLEAAGAVQRQGKLSFTLQNPCMAELLSSSGRTLETVLYFGLLQTGRCHDVELGCAFRRSLRDREVDVIATAAENAALFLSCKMGALTQPKHLLQYVLTEIHEAAGAFRQGAAVTSVLAAPKLPMRTRSGKPSREFLRAQNSGVLLLGREVFADANTLTRALTALAEGTQGEELLNGLL